MSSKETDSSSGPTSNEPTNSCTRHRTACAETTRDQPRVSPARPKGPPARRTSPAKRLQADGLQPTGPPFAPTSTEQPITSAAWRDKPSWFICGENDRMLLISLERDTAQRLEARRPVLRSSHVPMLSHPGDVAEIIADAAVELAGGPVEHAAPTEEMPAGYG